MLKWVFQPQLHILYGSLFSLWLWLWCYMVLRCSFGQAMLQVEVFAPWVDHHLVSLGYQKFDQPVSGKFFFFSFSLYVLFFFLLAKQTRVVVNIELLPGKRFLWFFYITNISFHVVLVIKFCVALWSFFWKDHIYFCHLNPKKKRKEKEKMMYN